MITLPPQDDHLNLAQNSHFNSNRINISIKNTQSVVIINFCNYHCIMSKDRYRFRNYRAMDIETGYFNLSVAIIGPIKYRPMVT